ncbi:MAG: hypothetical protein HRU18_03865 [Pseudoalteromonas sp.]|uniref:hypothetical protein n=1 Tax=Pseudoalteromonas sp. TaxID=53249 RepID=UPI001D3D9CD2|nr:hypothetical protein [Pseudoalteromonas sp.]NRA77324.1 hypothetical protein [Pseudoalteromonas sp.]
MKLKVEEINLNSADVFLYEKYPNDGVFLVFDEIQKNDFGGQLVLRVNNFTLFLCNGYDITFEYEDESEVEVKSDGSISQELFLKTLSLVVNKDESYKNN